VEQVCDGCTPRKQHRTSFPKASSFKAKKDLDLFHADFCGHVRPPTVGGRTYFLLVVDDFSRYMWIKLLRSKDEALLFLKKTNQSAKVEHEGRLKALRTDQVGEFNSISFTVFCNEECIKHYTTAPYSPQQNGAVVTLGFKGKSRRESNVC
jgi:transposase InsO family protein